MVLELIIIGGVVYYYVKKNKQEKIKKAALAAGEPFYHNDGAVTYPPQYPGLPHNMRGQPPMYDNKIQIPVQGDETVAREQPYTDAVPVDNSIGKEKGSVVVETREVGNEKN